MTRSRLLAAAAQSGPMTGDLYFGFTRLDLENLRRLDRVVGNGRSYTRTELDNLIAEKTN